MAFDMLIGNAELRWRLARDVQQHTLAHAYILEGPEGSGKRTLARAIAAALTCQGEGTSLPCMQCAACRKVFSGNAPDVVYVTRSEDKASIGVDEVRFLRTDVLFAPNDTDHKIYVIEEADLLTDAAQNALLLTLEEPPEYVTFLLLCRRSSALLETVRSRAPVLRLMPVPSHEIGQYLEKTTPAFAALGEKERQEVLLLADGSVGRAIVLSNEQERRPLMERRQITCAYLDAVLERKDAAALLGLMSRFELKRDVLIVQLEDIETALRDLVLLKRSDHAPLRFYTDREQVLALSEQISLSSLLALYDRVEQTRAAVQRNANIRLALTDLLLG